MNELGYFDYKPPTGAQNDDCMPRPTYQGYPKLREHKQFLQSIANKERHLTESQDQFSWKILKSSTVRTPAAQGIHFIKSFDETHLSNYPKLTLPISSVSQNDYQWKSKGYEECLPVKQHLTTEIGSNENALIDRCKFGFGKLLDPSATTNNLTYREYSREEMAGRTSKDVISFWNWKNTFEKQNTCYDVTQKCFQLRHREYQSCVKHVPHNGLMTEAKSNYVQHLNLTNFDSSHENNQFISFPDLQNERKSENTIYGSGIRIQKYLA